jgi:hypothetical protein
MRTLFATCILAASALPAWAIPVVDGTRDVEYGAARAVQTVDTGFGNNQSELDAGYARCCDDGRLYLMLAGNIQNNFNKLEIFIDSNPGGQSVFDSSGNDGAGAMDGLVFDTGFTADYHLIVRRGDGKLDIDFANLSAQSASGYFNVLDSGDFGVGTTGTGVNGSPIQVAYNGSNTGGVGDNCPGDICQAADQSAAAAVTTGLELGIALSDLNWDGRAIKIMAGQNNQNHNYWSNQFLGGMAPPQRNPGGDETGGFTGEGAINMNNFAGNQYFTTCPEPSSLLLVALAMVGFAGAARQRK